MADMPLFNEAEQTELVSYLDGELDETAAAKVEARLNLDVRVRSEADALRKTWELLDYLAKPSPSANFTNRTLERIALERSVMPRTRRILQWRGVNRALGWAAAVVVAAGIGFAGGRFLPHQSLPVQPESTEGDDRDLVKDFRVIQNKRLYETVGNLQFLKSLADPDDPDLFGDENQGS